MSDLLYQNIKQQYGVSKSPHKFTFIVESGKLCWLEISGKIKSGMSMAQRSAIG
jgi:hypothetical protein